MALILTESDVQAAKASLNRAYASTAALATSASTAGRLTTIQFQRVSALNTEVTAINAAGTFWGSGFIELVARCTAAQKEAYAIGAELATLMGVPNPVEPPPLEVPWWAYLLVIGGLAAVAWYYTR